MILERSKKSMGRFVNPDNSAFQVALNSKIYIDKTGQKFIVIIDEWDVLIRDVAINRQGQDEYITFLRGMFKGTEPTKYIQLAYLTGILPIKKEKTQSALNNFDEFKSYWSETSSYDAVVPKPEYKADYPALIVELKWNQNASTALKQVKDKKYVSSILNYTGDILLVGINYDKKSKKHECLIELYSKQD